MYRIVTAIAAGMLVVLSLQGRLRSDVRHRLAEASVDAKVAGRSRLTAETTFWVVLRQQANLSPAHSMRPAPRGRYVYDTLTTTANRTQRSLKADLGKSTCRTSPSGSSTRFR